MGQWSKKASVMIVCMTVLLTGCAESIPDMTEEQSAMVAEYAAGLLLKYDKNYSGALPEIVEVLPEEEIESAPEEQVEESSETEESISDGQDSPTTGAGENIVMDIDEFLGLSGVDITYIGYELSESYTEGESIAFSLDATPGNLLLIAKFNMTNNNSEDTEINILGRDIRFRLVPDPGGRKPVLYTMLLNDLSIYKGIIPAGTTEQVILVSEISQEEAGLESLSLYMRNGADSATVTLE